MGDRTRLRPTPTTPMELPGLICPALARSPSICQLPPMLLLLSTVTSPPTWMRLSTVPPEVVLPARLTSPPICVVASGLWLKSRVELLAFRFRPTWVLPAKVAEEPSSRAGPLMLVVLSAVVPRLIDEFCALRPPPMARLPARSAVELSSVMLPVTLVVACGLMLSRAALLPWTLPTVALPESWMTYGVSGLPMAASVPLTLVPSAITVAPASAAPGLITTSPEMSPPMGWPEE
ncbi:hypothetical protein D9M69_497310 [compost metagenome]